MRTRFTEALGKMRVVHEAKSHDYAQAGNVYSNFEFAADFAGEFPEGPDRVFATMMGVKLARLAELLSQQKVPRHESVEDTFLDLANYTVLWWTWRSQEAERLLTDRSADGPIFVSENEDDIHTPWGV